jgi:alpha-L-rhamnosidase
MNRLFVLVFIFLAACSATKKKVAVPPVKIFEKAEWIGYDVLPDSMKLIPAIHGDGNWLKQKAIARSVVPLFRKEFISSKTIKRATLYASGLGHYQLWINGKQLTDHFLAPGWTLYQTRVLYNTFDITSHIKKGNNALGAMVGNGFFNVNRERYRKLVVAYGYPRLIFQLQLEYTDGSTHSIVSDQTCKTTPAPITFTSIYGGEDYDARLEQRGWSTANFDDRAWRYAKLLPDTLGKLQPESDFPLKVMQSFPAIRKTTSTTGRTVYDFGQNTSGILSIKVKGNAGAVIKIKPDELINAEGNVTQISGGGPYELNYTLKGSDVEQWQPAFTYYGFRFADVEITDPPNISVPTELLDITMLHTRNSAPTVGTFSCSDTLFNKTFDLILWGIKSNMASVATDCPHREKLGWLEQTYLIGSSMHYNFDIHRLYTKIVDDMMDSQLDNGLVPDIAPEYVQFNEGFRDSPEWGSAAVIIPWQLYHWYGDKAILTKAYPMMEKYVAYLQKKSVDNIIDYGLGDWYDLGPKYPGEAQLTPKAVTATAIYYYDLQLMAKISLLLNHTTNADQYLAQAAQVKAAFLKKFYDPATGTCATNSQTAYAISLYTGLIPEGDKEKVFMNLVNSIITNNYSLTSGDVGYHFLVRVLSENGRSDILYKMNNRNDVPGYGYQIKKGATALTESWAALSNTSNNHMMLGHLMEWFYNGLGGIYQTEKSVGYRNLVLAPKPVGEITWVNCSYQSVAGMISSDWKITGDTFYWRMKIPNSSVARVVVPPQFMTRSCTVKNLTSGKVIVIDKAKSEFDLLGGEYELVAN